MAITPIGWLILIVGPLLMIVRPRLLYITTVFFLPFTATGVINVGYGIDASAIQVSMYLGSLLILRKLAGYLSKGKIPFPRTERIPLVWLGVFIAICAVSLIMPIWIDGRVLIPAPYLGDFSSQPLRLSSHNITAVLYMVYGYLLTYLTAIMNREPAMLRSSFKSFMAGSAFAALWAIFELVCKLSGIEYPAVIFNTGTAISTMGYQQVLADDIFRLSSVAVEPSILAQTLLIALSLYVPFVFGKIELFGKKIDLLLFSLLFAVLCLTTSSTAYAGMLLIGVFAFVLFSARGILKPRHFAIPLVGIASFGLLYWISPAVQEVLELAIFSKGESGSALERLMTVANAYQMFKMYPILGVGWASVASHDLIAHLLGNSGVLGFLFFFVAMYSIFRALFHSIKSRGRSLSAAGILQVDFGLYVALAVTLATCILSGFVYMFGFFWFLCGLAIAGSNGMAISKLELPKERRPRFTMRRAATITGRE